MQYQIAELQPIIVTRGCLYIPIDQNPAAISRTIEALINLLDSMEPDADLEPNLGAPEPQFLISTFPGSARSLGSIYRETSQEQWAQGGDDECEIVCEDEGAQCDDEGALYA